MIISERIGRHPKDASDQELIEPTGSLMSSEEIDKTVKSLTANLDKVFWTKLPVNKEEFLIIREMSDDDIKSMKLTPDEKIQLLETANKIGEWFDKNKRTNKCIC